MGERARVVTLLTMLAAAVVGVTGQAGPLRIVNAGPRGELARLEEAGQIRIVFSEPMVAIGTVRRGTRRRGFTSRLLRQAPSTGPAPPRADAGSLEAGDDRSTGGAFDLTRRDRAHVLYGARADRFARTA